MQVLIFTYLSALFSPSVTASFLAFSKDKALDFRPSLTPYPTSSWYDPSCRTILNTREFYTCRCCAFPSLTTCLAVCSTARSTFRTPAGSLMQCSTRGLCSDPCKDFHSQLQAIAQLQSEQTKKPTYLKLNLHKSTDTHVEPAIVEVNKV